MKPIDEQIEEIIHKAFMLGFGSAHSPESEEVKELKELSNLIQKEREEAEKEEAERWANQPAIEDRLSSIIFNIVPDEEGIEFSMYKGYELCESGCRLIDDIKALFSETYLKTKGGKE